MRARASFILTIGLLLPLASCGVPIRSGAHFAEGADVANPLSFAWHEGQDGLEGDPRLVNNRFFEDRLREAVEWQLSMRGIRRTDTTPDLLIHHHLSLADHEIADEIVDEWGYSHTDVYSFEEGTVVIHIVNAHTGADVWLGWAQANIESALHGPENMRKWVYDVVREMFGSWPALDRRQD